MIADMGVDRENFDSSGLSTGFEVNELLSDASFAVLEFSRDLFAQYGDMPYSQLDKQMFANSMVERAGKLQSYALGVFGTIQERALTNVAKSISNGFDTGVQSSLSDIQRQGGRIVERKYDLTQTTQGRAISGVAIDKLRKAQATSIDSAVRAFLTASIAVASGSIYNRYGTLFQSIDEAFTPLIRKGYVGVHTTDGRALEVANYGEMLVRESSQQALLQGESAVARESGYSLVHISAHASSCPLCTPYQDTILVDDYFADGKPDGLHELLSVAIENGLFHWNCRHKKQVVTGSGYIPRTPNYDPKKVAENYALEQQQRKLEREIREKKRVALATLDTDKQAKAMEQVRDNEAILNQFVIDARADGYEIYRQRNKENAYFTTRLRNPYGVNTTVRMPPRTEKPSFVTDYKSVVQNTKEVQNKTKNAFNERVENGLISLKINDGAMDKHFEGTNNYIAGKSYFTLEKKEVVKMIQSQLTKGDIRKGGGEQEYFEIIKFDRPIGKLIQLNGKEIEAYAVKVHYSKRGWHAVPRKN